MRPSHACGGPGTSCRRLKSAFRAPRMASAKPCKTERICVSDTTYLTILKEPAQDLLHIAAPTGLFPAYQHLDTGLCEETGLVNWLEVHVRPQGSSSAFKMSVSSGSQDWAESYVVSRPHHQTEELWIYRIPIIPRLDRLWDVREERKANLTLEVQRDGVTIYKNDAFELVLYRVDRALLRPARDRDDDTGVFGLFPVFVTPGDPTIDRFFSLTGAGTTGASAGGAECCAREFYGLIRENGCHFLPGEMPSTLMGFDTQLVKFPSKTLRDRTGNCLDYAVLFSTLMEHVGQQPRVVVLPAENHAISGWSDPVTGTRHLVDVSAAARGVPFEEALTAAEGLYDAAAPSERIVVDIRRRRMRTPPVKPFPFTVPSDPIQWSPLPLAAKTPNAVDGPGPELRRGVFFGLLGLVLAGAALAYLLSGIRGGCGRSGAPADQAEEIERSDACAPLPTTPTVFIAPFQFDGSGEESGMRTADEVLWPLLDRFLFNRLIGHETFTGRFHLVDPLEVQRQRDRREMGASLSKSDIEEVAHAVGANLILECTMERVGQLLFNCTLRAPVDSCVDVLEIAEADLEDAVCAIAGAFLATSRVEAAKVDTTPERLEQLLLKNNAVAKELTRLHPGLSFQERKELFDAAERVEPEAVGPAWLEFLDKDTPESRVRLRAALGTVRDEELRRVMEQALGDGPPGRCDDRGFDLVAARYPSMVGRLPAALCYKQKREYSKSLGVLLTAGHAPFLRFFAMRVAIGLPSQTMNRDEVIRMRRWMQESNPGYTEGWSTLAVWYSLDGMVEEAERAWIVARSLIRNDPSSLSKFFNHTAHRYLYHFKVDEAARWIRELDQVREAGTAPPSDFYLKALWYSIQGQFRTARAILLAGMDSEATRDSINGYHTLATSALYLSLYQHDLESAEMFSQQVEKALAQSGEPVDAYWLETLPIVMDHVRGRLDVQTAWAKILAAGENLSRESGEEQVLERSIQECLFLTHFTTDCGARCEALANIETEGHRRFVGGCILRYAQRKASEGEHETAVSLFKEAAEMIIWIKFLYVPFLPEVLFGWGASLEALGDRAEALEKYKLLVDLYGFSDSPSEVVTDARKAMHRLQR